MSHLFFNIFLGLFLGNIIFGWSAWGLIGVIGMIVSMMLGILNNARKIKRAMVNRKDNVSDNENIFPIEFFTGKGLNGELRNIRVIIGNFPVSHYDTHTNDIYVCLNDAQDRKTLEDTVFKYYKEAVNYWEEKWF